MISSANMVSIHIDPRSRMHAELLAFAATVGGGELAAFDNASATALTIRSGITRAPHSDGRCENTAHPERHTIADGSDFRGLIPARELNHAVKALASADIREIFPAFCFCRHGFCWSAFFPISRTVVHTDRADDVAVFGSELDVPRSQLHASAFHVGDRDSLDVPAVDSHVRDAGHVFDEEPRRLAHGNDPAGLLQHLPAVHNGFVLVVFPVHVCRAETLTRRPSYNAVEPARHAGELTDVAARDFVGCLDHAETSARECTVEQTNSWEK